MLATRLDGIGRIATVQVDTPAPGPGEVLIRVEAAGICGTDRHLFKGEFPCTPPVTLGHEFCGIVTALGPGTTGPAIGTRVTCDPNIACGTCPMCLRGRVNLCRNLIAIGIYRDGGFAELVAIPAHRAIPLPADMDPHHGAFCEPLACTLHGIDLASIRPGDTVAILGGGVIGLLALQLAHLAGARVVLVTRQSAKRQLAERLGAFATAADAAGAAALLGDGADVVLECAGVVETVEMAPALTRTGGTIVILGVTSQGVQARIEPFDLLFREINILHSFLNPNTQSRAAALIANGQIDVAPLISRVISLHDAPNAIANPPRPGEVKVLISPATH